MSHPVPGREYGNESEPKSPREKAIARKIKSERRKPSSISKLKRMIAEPASKEWFNKYSK